MHRLFAQLWYGRARHLAWLLWPISLLFCALVRLRRLGYRRGWLHRERLPVPVVVVGNLTVGGVGKTPLVAKVVEILREAGWRPGIIARGYGGNSGEWPRAVAVDSDPAAVGDEPVLLARRTGVPVAVGPDRLAAAHLLLPRGVDVIVSDDGMQHYRLERDVEVAVIDGDRRFGNGLCLPAGPLREPARRLAEADLVVGNGNAGPGEYSMGFRHAELHAVADPQRQAALADYRGRQVHAVAGIGNPARFFAMLRRAGLIPVEHPFPDHHPYRAEELDFREGLPLIMTEKDAVKCAPFAGGDWWYLPIEAELPAAFGVALTKLLKKES